MEDAVNHSIISVKLPIKEELVAKFEESRSKRLRDRTISLETEQISSINQSKISCCMRLRGKIMKCFN